MKSLTLLLLIGIIIVFVVILFVCIDKKIDNDEELLNDENDEDILKLNEVNVDMEDIDV